MGEEKIIKNIVEELKGCPFIKGIVLGGSRATGTAAADSDFDIGIYYEEGTIDYVQLNAAAKRLDDASRDNLICREGEWGPWVNCGGWLVVEGRPVDLILRNIARVKQVIEKTDAGEADGTYKRQVDSHFRARRHALRAGRCGRRARERGAVRGGGDLRDHLFFYKKGEYE